jgi:hypothetical protein
MADAVITWFYRDLSVQRVHSNKLINKKERKMLPFTTSF